MTHLKDLPKDCTQLAQQVFNSNLCVDGDEQSLHRCTIAWSPPEEAASPGPEGTAPRHTLVADDYETLCESRGVMGKNPSLAIDKGASSTFQSSAFALDWTPGGPEDKDAVRVLSAGGGDGRRPR